MASVELPSGLPGPEDGLFSESAPKDPNAILFEFITNGVLLCVVCALGLVGNALSIFILSRPAMRSSTNLLLGGLARCDAALLTTSLFLFGLPSLHEYQQHLRTSSRRETILPPHLPPPPGPPPSPGSAPTYVEIPTQQGGILFDYNYRVYPLLAPVLFPLALTAQTASVYLTLTVTLERWVAVCHPLKARSLCTQRRARMHVVGAMAFALLYNLPRFWEVRRGKITTSPPSNITMYFVFASSLRSDPTYISVYVNWSYLVVMYVLPFGGLAVLNAAIYRQVRRANRERQRLSRLQKKEIGLATMLLIVVVVFFLCNLLALVNNVLESFYGIIVDQLVKTSNLLVTVNSSVNFIIYVTFGERFRRLFLKMFCGKKRRTTGWATRFAPGGSRAGGIGEGACSLAGPDSLGGSVGGRRTLAGGGEEDEESVGTDCPRPAESRRSRRRRSAMALVRIVSSQNSANGGPPRKSRTSLRSHVRAERRATNGLQTDDL
ncbi:hypothetical protein J437_LFUL002389 [Ladona fulva]|uniref:G-protein coupled receptors family 1 profile domain-containing protein n=1 Tax=Ladona fulva TaxID=123851 RepID=A0A8K0K384_LADFU|nr:hypothetical protein J437_LFUL002389 [Ladona fulva]